MYLSKTLTCCVGITIFLLAGTWSVSCRAKKQDCKSLKDGTFYFYPGGSNGEIKLIREDSIQQEINATSGDTAYWKINWTSDCSFISTFIKSTQFPGYATDRPITISILSITGDYYINKISIDSAGSSKSLTDTIWLKRK